MWNLEQGLMVVRMLQPTTRNYGFHLAIGGGVVNKGRSDKDLDLYFLPLDDEDTADTDGLLGWLEGTFGASEPIGNAEYGNARTSNYKHKVKFTDVLGDKRIDVFIS